MGKRIIYGFIATASLFLAAVALVAIFGRLSGRVFIDLLNMGWVGFIFARVVAVFLVVPSIRRAWRSSPRFTALITALSLLGFGAFVVVKSHFPDGMYGFVGEIEPANDSADLFPEFYHKDHFWRLSRGKLEECYGNLCTNQGRYEKTADGWVVGHETKEPFVMRLEFSVFGLRMITKLNNGPSEFYPRRIIPFARPFWMPDWMQ